MNNVRRFLLATAALVALSGLAFSADEYESGMNEPGLSMGETGASAGGKTTYRSYSSSGPGGTTVYRSYSSGGPGGSVKYKEEYRSSPGWSESEGAAGAGAGGAMYKSYTSSGTGGATYGTYSSSGAGGATETEVPKHGSYGIDVDTRTGGSYPGVTPDTTTGTDTSQGMGGITGGRSGSYKFGIGGQGAGGTMGSYTSSAGTAR